MTSSAAIRTPPTLAYQTITSTLSFPSRDDEFWWHTYAPLLATLLHSADYDVHDQYRHLLFFQRHVVPALGPCPVRLPLGSVSGGGDSHRDRNRLDGFFRTCTITGSQPVELSVNYQQDENATVRYTFEPGSHMSRPPAQTTGMGGKEGLGTGLGFGSEARDPFNNLAVRETLNSFARGGVSFDQGAYDHFTRALAVDGTARGEREAVLQRRELEALPALSQQAIALDLKKERQGAETGGGRGSESGSGIFPKLYSFPQARAAISGVSVGKLIFDAFRNWRHNDADRSSDGGGDGKSQRVVNEFPGLALLEEYFASPPDQSSASTDINTTPTVLFSSCDLVTPPSSSSSSVRAKIYVSDPTVTFSRVKSLWTLDGALTQRPSTDTDTDTDADADPGLTLLHDLWQHLGLDKHQDNEEEHPSPSPPSDRLRSKRPLLINYELPSSPSPSTSSSAPSRVLPKVYIPLIGVNDGQIARGLTSFMRRIGWTQHAGRYEDMVGRMYAGYDLDETVEAHAWVSFAYSASGGVYLTVYLYALDVV